jgi:hypothetical protein
LFYIVKIWLDTNNQLTSTSTSTNKTHEKQMNEITQTNFTMWVVAPNLDLDHGVLRIRYVSQNPSEDDRGTTFYQCADVSVTKTSEEDLAKKAASTTAVATATATAPVRKSVTTELEQVPRNRDRLQAPVGGVDCCAPKQFTMQAYETGSWRNPTTKKYFFDAPTQMFRIDTNSGTGKSRSTSFDFILHVLISCWPLVLLL